MRLTFILIILVLNTIGVVICEQNLILQNIKPDQCDLAKLNTLQVVQKYFSNQEVITIIVHTMPSTICSVDYVLLMCIVTRLNKSILQYSNAREIELHHQKMAKKYLEIPSITSCYTIVGETYDKISTDLKILSKINPTAKYILILRKKNIPVGEQLLSLAWDSYKMLRLVVIMPSVRDELRHLNVITYNPFVCRDFDCELRGQFFNFHLDDKNYETIIDEIVRLMEDQDSNLNKIPLRIYMYEWKSFARAVRNPLNRSEIIRFRLLDGEILSIFAHYMNFKMVFVGDIKTNTVAGSIRAVDREEADIAANSRIISDYTLNNTVFLTQLYLISLNYIAPKQYTSKILNVFIYSMFDWNTEIIMVAIFIILILVWYLLNYFYEKFTKQSEANSIPRSLMIVTASQYFVSIKFTKFLKGHQQILFGSMLLYSIVVSSNFQGSIVKQLATDVEDRDVNTLEQLANSPYEILYVQTLNDFLDTPRDLPKTSTLYKLYNKQTVLRNSIDDRVPEIAYNKTISILCTKLVAEEFASQYLDENNGRPLLHVVRQPLVEFYYSFIVPKTSPYRERFHEMIRRAVEAGVLRHEQKRIEWRTKLNGVKAIIRYAKNQFLGGNKVYKGVTIEQIKTLFVMWGYLLTVAFFVFIIEVSVFYLCPKYQKYNIKNDL